MDTYLILPGCDDTNRGDQALIWETKGIAELAGYHGDYYMLAEADKSAQSKREGICNCLPVLNHPSAYFKSSHNVKYSFYLKVKWGFVSLFDMIRYGILLHPIIRRLLLPLYSHRVKESISVFSRTKVSFVKGGGFLHAYGGLSDSYKIYYFLFHIRLALSFGHKVFVMPNSFGPFDSPFVKRMLRRTLSKCDAVMSRETISQAMLLQQCRIQSHCFRDIAFYLEADDTFDAAVYLKGKGIPIDTGRCVALTVRPYRFPGEGDPDTKYHAYKESFIEICRWLAGNEYTPVLIQHVASNQEHEDDMSCIADIESTLRDCCKYHVLSDMTLDSRQMKSIYGCFEAIIGTRFHSIIFSLEQAVPAVAVTYGGNKGKGIMHDLGLEQYCIPISEITSQKLIDITRSMLSDKDQIRDVLANRMPAIRAEKEMIASLIRREQCQH